MRIGVEPQVEIGVWHDRHGLDSWSVSITHYDASEYPTADAAKKAALQIARDCYSKLGTFFDALDGTLSVTILPRALAQISGDSRVTDYVSWSDQYLRALRSSSPASRKKSSPR